MACTSGNMSIARDRCPPFDERFRGWGSEDRDFAYRAFAAGLRVVLLERLGLVHLWTTSEGVDWNPTKGGAPESIVSALASKLLLYRKYPGELMTPSLDLVRYCHHDPHAGTWRVGTRRDASIGEVLDEFDAWLASREARRSGAVATRTAAAARETACAHSVAAGNQNPAQQPS
jgi:hypothetical protein